MFHTNEEQLEDTILHEVAHAIAGSRAGHGPAWKSVCREIGANPNRTVELMPGQTDELYKWESRCPTCENQNNGRGRKKHHRRGKIRRGFCSNQRGLPIPIEYRSLAQPNNGWNTF